MLTNKEKEWLIANYTLYNWKELALKTGSTIKEIYNFLTEMEIRKIPLFSVKDVGSEQIYYRIIYKDKIDWLIENHLCVKNSTIADKLLVSVQTVYRIKKVFGLKKKKDAFCSKEVKDLIFKHYKFNCPNGNDWIIEKYNLERKCLISFVAANKDKIILFRKGRKEKTTTNEQFKKEITKKHDFEKFKEKHLFCKKHNERFFGDKCISCLIEKT